MRTTVLIALAAIVALPVTASRGQSPEAFAAIVKSETVKWVKVIKAAGVKPD